MEKQLTNPAIIRALRIKEFKIELSENSKGLPVARYYQMMSSGKNKGQYKLIEGYFFQNEARREAWVSKKIADIKARISDKENRIAAKKEIRANMKHDFEVGQIYYDSWGYDQTNIDFYKVIEVKEKSVVIQEIGSKFVPGTQGMDCSNVVPNPEAVCGKPMLKIINFYIQNDGSPKYFIKSKHGWISKFEKGDKGVYCSWGR